MRKYRLLLSLVIVCALILSLTACSEKKVDVDKPDVSLGNNDTVDNEENGENDIIDVDTDNVDTDNVDTDIDNIEEIDISLQDIVETLRNTYGDLYLPSEELDEEIFLMMIGLNDVESSDYYNEFYASVPLIGTHIDKLFIAKTDDVEKMFSVFEDYMRVEAEEAFQYPMNMVKVNHSVITSYNDYVILFILGGYPDIPNDVDENAFESNYYQEMNALGLKALDVLFEDGVIPEESTPFIPDFDDMIVDKSNTDSDENKETSLKPNGFAIELPDNFDLQDLSENN